MTHGSTVKAGSAPAATRLTSPAFLTALEKAGVKSTAAVAAIEDLEALATMKLLAETSGKAAEPFLLPYLPTLVERAALPKKQEALATASIATAQAIVENASAASVKPIVLTMLSTIVKENRKWQNRVAALNLITAVSKVTESRTAVANALVDLVPMLSDAMCDARPEVSAAAEAAMLASCLTLDNVDLERVIPAIVSSMARPAEVPETIHLVSATTFVKAVEKPTLAILVPLLARGLVERVTSIKRITAVIIENMTKLVMKREHAEPLLPVLLPGLAKLRDEVADPECRAVATKSFGVLLAAAGVDEATAVATYGIGKAAPKEPATPVVDMPTMESETALVEPMVREAMKKQASYSDLVASLPAVGAAATTPFAISVKHITILCAGLSLLRDYEPTMWTGAVVPFLKSYVDDAAAAEAIATELREKICEKNGGMDVESFVDDYDDGTPDLCKAEFSLAYGAKTLLNTATLHLKVGKKYGLIGPERCGKSTLMRAMSNGQLEGFPSRDVVRTVYVDSTIKAEDADFSVLDFVLQDPDVISAGNANKDAVVAALTGLGFTSTMLGGVVGRLSGGWRCKLALARAQLSNSDIYLLDEPTNHLDKKNVAWLIEYIKSLTTTTCIMVSHDSNFLDQTCSHIVHFDGFKLRTYRGNLSEFVKHKPETASYYELSASKARFHFPAPGFLEGIKSKDRAIVKMQNVAITYPGRDTPVVTEVNLSCSLSSRVVVLGANGAGKSTVIKCLVGELLPTSGLVWRHPNLRIAYVAQDAFHHLADHQKNTPMEYIQWRYATGEDREAQMKASTKTTADEEKKQTQAVMMNGVKLVVSQVLSRRKAKSSYEYEVEWVGQTPDKNQWMSREWLTEHGWAKACDAVDAREAAAAGLHSKPLTATNICAHMAAVGLDPEITAHSRINALSGGQLIKVVIGAAMWMNPHLLIMDEPTNFLDRDSLGALAAAIKEFEGGVLLITHHHDFTKELCGETWTVGDGKVMTVGQSWDTSIIEKKEEEDETVDAMGNVIKLKKKLTGKALKQHLKEKKERRKRGEEVSSDEDEEL